MTNIDIANGLIFQALEVEKDTFDERLLSQKKIFLLENLGVEIGYSYNWYIRGPYSPDLTSYIFANLDMLREQDLSKYSLSENVKANKKPDSLDTSSWYELLASIFYIRKMWKKNKDDAFPTLIKYKPKYTKDQFDAAVSLLENSGYEM